MSGHADSEAKATARPWRMNDRDVWSCAEDGTYRELLFSSATEYRSYARPNLSNEEHTANAALIVRAVNAHDDLVDVAKIFESSIEYEINKDLIHDDEEGARMKAVTLDIVRDALAKAKEQ